MLYLIDGGKTNKYYFIIPSIALFVFDIFLLTPITLFIFVSLLLGDHILNLDKNWDDSTTFGKIGRYLHVAVPFAFPVSAMCTYIAINLEFAIRTADNFDLLYVAGWFAVALLITGISKWLNTGRHSGGGFEESVIGPGISVIACIFGYLLYAVQGYSWIATGSTPKYLYMYQFDYIMLIWAVFSITITLIIMGSFISSRKKKNLED